MEIKKYSDNLEFRIKNCDKFISLLEEEKSITNEVIKELESSTEASKKLECISKKKRVIELDQEILAKKEYVSKLRDKIEIDFKEFKRNIGECNAKYKELVAKADTYIEEQYALTEGEFLNKKAATIQFQLNSLLETTKLKDDGARVFYYNALKKELSLLDAQRELEKAKAASV